MHVEAPPLSLSITLVTYSNSKWVEPLKVVLNTGLCTAVKYSIKCVTCLRGITHLYLGYKWVL